MTVVLAASGAPETTLKPIAAAPAINPVENFIVNNCLKILRMGKKDLVEKCSRRCTKCGKMQQELNMVFRRTDVDVE